MRHLITRALRPVAVLATGALIATTLSTPAQAAAPEDRSASWLQRQLTDGLVVGEFRDDFTDPENPTWVEYNDYGLTADVAFGLDAIGGHRRAVKQIGAAIAPHVDSWTTGVDFGSSDIYAGSVAKAVVLAQTAGRNPRHFGRVDLVQRLEERVATEAPIAGRIQDSGEQDYSNTLGQAFAVLGLAEADSDRSGAARSFLLQQQCSEGFFRLYFADKAAEDQGCDAGTEAQSEPDTDVTALAMVLLKALPNKGKKVRGALKDAKSWLKATQKKNGSFGGGVATQGSNSNSTGLAAWALGDTGACRPAVKAASWVKKLQVRGKVRGTEFAGEKGAIAYDRAAKRLGRAEGITRETRDQWRRATSQAAPGLTNTSLKRCRR